MADHTVNPAPSATNNAPEEPLVSRLRWNYPATEKPGRTMPMSVVMDMSNRVHDLAYGISTIADFLLQDDLHRGSEEDYAPILTATQRESFTRLLAVAADIVVAEADKTMQLAYDYNTPEGIQERRRRPF